MSKHINKLMTDSLCRIIDEVDILQGKVRADIMVLNGHMHGFEIKSSYDDLSRLPNQIDAYSKVFDYSSVVLAEKHLEGALRYVPDWWGVYIIRELEKKPCVIRYKQAKKNLNTDPHEVVKLLWKDEVLRELSNRNLDIGIKSKPKKILWEKLAESIELHELMYVVRENLKARTNWRVA